MTDDQLLPRNALAGRRVALSASDSADLDRLGLLQAHFHLAFGEIARTILTADGKLAYGGHLRPEGLTTFLVTELERWRKGPDVLGVYLPWSVHRGESVTDLRTFEDLLDTAGTTFYLGVDGEPILDYLAGRPEEKQAVPPAEEVAGLTGMRRYVTEQTDARVLLGGKRLGFKGRYPGLVEEADFALMAGQPLFLAGGFGGVTHDIARALGVDRLDWLPPSPDHEPPVRGLTEGLAKLEQIGRQPGWRGLGNGLDAAENQRLATTHRPSEIAALVGLGVGRLARNRPN